MSFHERVRAGYRALAAADPGSWVVVDGRRGPGDAVARELWRDGGRPRLRPLPSAGPVSASTTDVRPALGLFADVVGQADAVEQLRAAARRPVHAYLVVGPPGVGQRPLVRGFAAALLCPHGGDGTCEACRRSLAGIHPDLVEVERTGALLSVGDARRVVLAGPAATAGSAAPGHRGVGLQGARLAAPGAAEDPRGAGRPDRVRVAGRARAPRAGHRGQPLCPDRPAPGAAGDAAAMARCRRGSTPRWSTSWPRRRGGASTGPGCWSTTTVSPTGARCGGRCRRRLDGTGSAAADLAAELLASAEEAVGTAAGPAPGRDGGARGRGRATGERGVPGARRSRIATTARNDGGGPTRSGPGSVSWPAPTGTALR